MKLLVLSGGRHPYDESTPILEGFLKAAGHHVMITEEASVLKESDNMNLYDGLIFNTRRENVPDFGDSRLSAAEQDGLKNFIRSGKGFICVHISCCLPDHWPGFHDITGGGWVTGTSFHPPYGEMTVNISDASHQAAMGISDFTTNDELYMNLALREGNEVFITGDAESGTFPWGPKRQATHMPGGTFPLGWTRNYGNGKVFVLLLGHDGQSFKTPDFQKLVLNGVDWATS